MERVTAIYTPNDYPAPDAAIKEELAALFNHLRPGVENPVIDKNHTGIAVAAQNPTLALNLAKMSGFLAGAMPWSKRRDLWELSVQTVNVHFKSDYSFAARNKPAAAAGISLEMQNALKDRRQSNLFNDEQKLVIDYTRAVVTGAVPEELFARVKEAFGEKGAVEFTAVVGFWSFWAMFLNATAPDNKPED